MSDRLYVDHAAVTRQKNKLVRVDTAAAVVHHLTIEKAGDVVKLLHASDQDKVVRAASVQAAVGEACTSSEGSSNVDKESKLSSAPEHSAVEGAAAVDVELFDIYD